METRIEIEIMGLTQNWEWEIRDWFSGEVEINLSFVGVSIIPPLIFQYSQNVPLNEKYNCQKLKKKKAKSLSHNDDDDDDNHNNYNTK